MLWPAWWQVLAALALPARSLSQPTPTICEEEACRCDSFTRVICNCTSEFDTVTLRPDGVFRVPPMATGIVVDSCARVQFLSETIKNLIHLRTVEIRNTSNVVFQDRALAWAPFSRDLDSNPGIRIIIERSVVNEIASNAIQGRVQSIVISESRLNHIKPFAFSSLTGVMNIELVNNDFNRIEIQAFKHFTTSNFILRGGTIRTLPSRFLSDVEVTRLFRMEGVIVNYVFSSSFLVTLPERVIIESNIINVLEGDSFHMVTRGPITFRNNTITTLSKGAFFGLSAHAEVVNIKGSQELLIDNNTITNLIPSSLMYDQRTLTQRIDGLNINVTCSCDLADEWRRLLKEQAGTVNCWYALEGYFISLSTFVDIRCGKFKQTFWIFVVVGILIILVVAAIGLYIILKRENEKKKKLQIVMPDGKTYRETEFHIVVERAELLTTDL